MLAFYAIAGLAFVMWHDANDPEPPLRGSKACDELNEAVGVKFCVHGPSLARITRERDQFSKRRENLLHSFHRVTARTYARIIAASQRKLKELT